MQLSTKYFGAVEYDPQDVISFPQGIFGFESEKEFLLLPFANSNGNLLCFQSVATPSLAFIVMNPFALYPEYAPVLSDSELSFMGVQTSQELCYYVLCVVREPVSQSTVNLKCPIVIHDGQLRAIQVILEGDTYHMRHLLGDFSAGGVSEVC